MAKATPKKLGEQLRAAIDGSDKTRYRICKETGIAESVLSRFMAGGSLNLETIETLLEALNLEVVKAAPKPTKKKKAT